MPTVLLTGATGYIASHTWLSLLDGGYDVVGIDNFSNSSPRVIERLAELSGSEPAFHEADVCDRAALDAVFGAHHIDAVVHFAAFKAVGESTAQPLRYYANNLGGLVTLCQSMLAHDVVRMVFSSSCTVYGDPATLPITEDAPRQGATNPYGWTKYMGEQILADVEAVTPGWQQAVLRYFNPVGAHPSGRMGEDPRGVPGNLMPYVAQVAVGRRDHVDVFGGDYPTPDGTGVRDYIHVVDLADGHTAALRRLLSTEGSVTVNLGTGRGYSVLELIAAYSTASGRDIPHRIVDRRPGDVAASYADPGRAADLLGWRAVRGLEEMCADSWRWQSANPDGYGSDA